MQQVLEECEELELTINTEMINKMERKVNHEGKEYQVYYQHKRRDMSTEPIAVESAYSGRPLKLNAVTTAFIKTAEGQTIEQAEAYCAVGEQFCRETGRIISTGRLVQKLQQGLMKEAT